MRLDFYVVSNFGLPSDGLPGLSSMRSERMVVIPDSNVVRNQEKVFWLWVLPGASIPQAYGKEKSEERCVPTQTVWDFPAEQGQRTLTNFKRKSREVVVERHPDSSGTSEQLLDQGNWIVVKATVIGSHVIPDRTAMHVQNARVGSDICIAGSSQHKNGKDKQWKPQFV